MCIGLHPWTSSKRFTYYCLWDTLYAQMPSQLLNGTYNLDTCYKVPRRINDNICMYLLSYSWVSLGTLRILSRDFRHRGQSVWRDINGRTWTHDLTVANPRIPSNTSLADHIEDGSKHGNSVIAEMTLVDWSKHRGSSHVSYLVKYVDCVKVHSPVYITLNEAGNQTIFISHTMPHN